MRKKNYIKYIETDQYPNVIKPKVMGTSPVKLNETFSSEYFRNTNAITLELGCGRGEYTVHLARKYPGRNFIGMDIKTSRLWHGAKMAFEENLKNVLFVKLKVELISQFFCKNTISEIWLPFPEPKIVKLNGKKCLTSERFLNMYKDILVPNGNIHVKTDDRALYEFSLKTVSNCSAKLIRSTGDVYEFLPDEYQLTSIQTKYEKKYIAESKKIKYLQFSFC